MNDHQRWMGLMRERYQRALVEHPWIEEEWEQMELMPVVDEVNVWGERL